MGNTNMDMTRSKIFNAGVYACAAVGALTGAIGYGGATVGGILGMGAVGAVAGGLGIPLALTATAVAGYVGYVAVKSTIKALKTEWAAIPLGLAIVGISAAKALFVEPVKKLHGMIFKDSAQKPAARSVEDLGHTEAPAQSSSSFFSKAKLRDAFAAVRLPQLLRKTPKPAPQNTPKPPAP